MVDAQPAREHVRQLIDRGMLQRDIAAAASVSPAGYRVGRCTTCGERAPLRPVSGQQTLIAHPTLNVPAGDDL